MPGAIVTKGMLQRLKRKKAKLERELAAAKQANDLDRVAELELELEELSEQ